MRVRITCSSKDSYWYAGRIGEVFEVKDYPPNHWQVLNTINTINKLNCEILPEATNELEQIAEQIAELRARLDELEAQIAQIAAKPPAVPHWRDTVSEKNPVLVTYGDRKSILLDGIMCFCTDYDPVKGYWIDQEWWKYAKRVPQSVVEKILAGYSTASEEE